MGRTVFVVTGSTESGDEYVFVFDTRPTREFMEAFFAKEMPEEWEAECIQGWVITEEAVRHGP